MISLISVLSFTWVGCTSQPLEPAAVDSVDEDVVTVLVEPSEVELYPGDWIRFEAHAMLGSGETTPVEVDWSTSGGTVDADGVFTAGAEAGLFEVEAREHGAGGVGSGRGSAAVRVKQRQSGEEKPDASNQLPQSSFVSSCDGMACAFDGTESQDADGHIVAHSWTFGDGNSVDGELADHVYADEGAYDVRLTVTDDAGGSSSMLRTIQVSEVDANEPPVGDNEPPVGDFEYNCSQLTCSFDGGGTTDPDGSVMSWVWGLGDGTEAEGVLVEHTFGSSGTYDVTLTVADDGGLEDTVTREVTVQESPVPTGDPYDTTIEPGEDIQSAVEANGSGTRFTILAGVHRIPRTVQPKAGQQFSGDPGAIVSGAKLLTQFVQEGGLWVALNQTQENAVNGNHPCDSEFPACARTEDLFIDDQPLKQVLSKSQVGPGTFYFDYGADRIYFWDDPTGRKVEASGHIQRAFNIQADNVVVQGLTIEKFANSAQTAALEATNADGVIYRDNTIRLNHGFGASICCASGGRMESNRINQNGELAVAGWGSIDLLIDGNEIAHNNFAGYSRDWEGGAMKLANTQRLVFTNNHVHHNFGIGIWLDIDNIDAYVARNVSEHNTHMGVHHEISYAAVYEDNDVRYNGGSGILITGSSDVEVRGNRVHDNGDHQIVLRDDYQEGRTGRWGPWTMVDALVRDNQIAGGRLSALQTSRSNCFRTNDYTIESERPFRVWGTTYTLAEWRALGHDDGSC